MPRGVYLVMVLQALAMCTAPLYFLVGGLVGNRLAPDPGLATLPVALIIVSTALTVVPATRTMQRWGRRRVFLAAALVNAAGALIAAQAILAGSFLGFCCGGIAAGAAIAVAQQYRFAAMEQVAATQAPRAASRVLLAGLVSAWLGPELASWGARLAPGLGLRGPGNAPAFAAAFLLLALLTLLAALIIALCYRDGAPPAPGSSTTRRPLAALMRRPGLQLAVAAAALGYAMMSFMMTAAPLTMHHVEGHSLDHTKWVIQSHIVAMFAPSLFTGALIVRLGHRVVIALGTAIYVVCLGVAGAGHALMHYWWSMLLLGIGWNFLFVAGTALLPRHHEPEERFRVQSLNEFLVFGAQASAALASGWVVNRLGWPTLVSLSAVAVALLAGVLWVTRRDRL